MGADPLISECSKGPVFGSNGFERIHLRPSGVLPRPLILLLVAFQSNGAQNTNGIFSAKSGGKA
jgi:hypothetical protein